MLSALLSLSGLDVSPSIVVPDLEGTTCSRFVTILTLSGGLGFTEGSCTEDDGCVSCVIDLNSESVTTSDCGWGSSKCQWIYGSTHRVSARMTCYYGICLGGEAC